MSRIEVRRVFQSNRVTLGSLVAPRLPSPLCTIELPWVGNRIGVSRIPPGEYGWFKWTSPTKGEVIRLDDSGTKPRTAILIHVANVPSNIEGCLGVGMGYHEFDSGWGVARSKIAMDALMEALPSSGTIRIFDSFIKSPPSEE